MGLRPNDQFLMSELSLHMHSVDSVIHVRYKLGYEEVGKPKACDGRIHVVSCVAPRPRYMILYI